MRHVNVSWLWATSIVVAAVRLLLADAHADPRAGEKKAQICLLCHRVESAVGAPTLEQQPAKYLAAQTNAFKSGKRVGPEMQANVARLSARDIQDVSDYFSSQKAKPARIAVEPPAQMIAIGAAAAKQLNCGSCHSENYRGGKDVPRLAGQVPHYLARQIVDAKRGVRPHPLISAKAGELSESTIEALGAYFGKLEP